MTSVSKHVCIDKLDDIVNEYNNTYHRTIKMKPADVKDNTYDSSAELHTMELHLRKLRSNKDPKFKVDDQEFQNTKTFLLKDTHQIGLKNFVIKKVKNTVPWIYVVNDPNGE